jgi:hypothetical protein
MAARVSFASGTWRSSSPTASAPAASPSAASNARQRRQRLGARASARDLRPRVGVDGGGDEDANSLRRGVSVGGAETRQELGWLHGEMAAQREARRRQRHRSLALAVWDGHHDLLPLHPLRRSRTMHFVGPPRAQLDEATSSSEEEDEAEVQQEEKDGEEVQQVGVASHPAERDTAECCSSITSSVPMLSVALVICGCCSQLPYEQLNSADRGCATLVSTCEAIWGLCLTAPAALRQPAWSVPLTTHLWLALSAVMYPLLLNQALASPLPIVLLSTLKNGNLVANALVGLVLLGKRYSTAQLLSVGAVSAGLAMTALAGTAGVAASQEPSGVDARHATVAVVCLLGALFARALTGGLQEAAFARCDHGGAGGRASASEVLFFRNVFGLPVLLIRGVLLPQGPVGGTLHHAGRWWREPLLGGIWPWPSVFGLLLANLVFDYACKMLCSSLIGHRSGGSLHTTLVTQPTFTLQPARAYTYDTVSGLASGPEVQVVRTDWGARGRVVAGEGGRC